MKKQTKTTKKKCKVKGCGRILKLYGRDMICPVGHFAISPSIQERVSDWVKAMWDMDILDHKDWDCGEDEVIASIMSYIDGEHLK